MSGGGKSSLECPDDEDLNEHTVDMLHAETANALRRAPKRKQNGAFTRAEKIEYQHARPVHLSMLKTATVYGMQGLGGTNVVNSRNLRNDVRKALLFFGRGIAGGMVEGDVYMDMINTQREALKLADHKSSSHESQVNTQREALKLADHKSSTHESQAAASVGEVKRKKMHHSRPPLNGYANFSRPVGVGIAAAAARTAARSTEKASAKTADTSSARSTEKASAKTADTSSAKTADTSSARSTENASAKTADTSSAKTTKKASAKTTKKASAKTEDTSSAKTADTSSAKTTKKASANPADTSSAKTADTSSAKTTKKALAKPADTSTKIALATPAATAIAPAVAASDGPVLSPQDTVGTTSRFAASSGGIPVPRGSQYAPDKTDLSKRHEQRRNGLMEKIAMLEKQLALVTLQRDAHEQKCKTQTKFLDVQRTKNVELRQQNEALTAELEDYNPDQRDMCVLRVRQLTQICKRATRHMSKAQLCKFKENECNQFSDSSSGDDEEGSDEEEEESAEEEESSEGVPKEDASEHDLWGDEVSETPSDEVPETPFDEVPETPSDSV